MIFPFECSRCEKDKWLIKYNSEERAHSIECVNCGDKQILEHVFTKRRKANVKKTIKKDKETKDIPQGFKQTQSGGPTQSLEEAK